MTDKVYLIHSEYIQHGMVFNSRTRYVKDKTHALQIYEETLMHMKEDNSNMLSDKENYMINKGGKNTNKFFSCSYRYQPQASGFLVEISSEVLE